LRSGNDGCAWNAAVLEFLKHKEVVVRRELGQLDERALRKTNVRRDLAKPGMGIKVGLRLRRRMKLLFDERCVHRASQAGGA
jgi:hypothetical protein